MTRDLTFEDQFAILGCIVGMIVLQMLCIPVRF